MDVSINFLIRTGSCDDAHIAATVINLEACDSERVS